MQLSIRMQRLASMVEPGNRLADVGTDHGYIPIALVQEGKIPSAIAMDVNAGPLKRADEHIQAFGLDTYIATRLSDGLVKLKPGEADTVLIAGMGGQLTVRILSGGAHCLDTVKELILQPQSEIFLVRRWLAEHDFRILEEDIVLEEGKYYPMMKAVHGRPGKMDEAELYYGVAKLQKSRVVWAAYLKRELKKRDQILTALGKSSQARTTQRVQEMEKEKARILRALEQMTEQEIEK
jgi:tRNA (adenine22-N1)-methyltransferase